MTRSITADAVRLRIFLTSALVLLLGAGAALTVFGLQYLQRYAVTVNNTVAQASSSSGNVDTTQQQIAEFEKYSDVALLAQQIVAQSASYSYQNDAYSDLLKIANRAGVSIKQYSFSSTGTGSSTPSGVSGGINTTDVTITLENPVNYKNFLNFLHYVEQNLTKMQIKSVSLSSDGTGNASVVNTGVITVEVYTQ